MYFVSSVLLEHTVKSGKYIVGNKKVKHVNKTVCIYYLFTWLNHNKVYHYNRQIWTMFSLYGSTKMCYTVFIIFNVE